LPISAWSRSIGRWVETRPPQATAEPAPEESRVVRNPTLREVAEGPSFKAALESIADVSTAEDFEFERDLRRRSKPA